MADVFFEDVGSEIDDDMSYLDIDDSSYDGSSDSFDYNEMDDWVTDDTIVSIIDQSYKYGINQEDT